MDFAWDSDKSEANLRDRGFDFEFASVIFEGPTLEKIDRRREYGEVRVVAGGTVAEICITVVYTDRPDETGNVVRRIISARRSSRNERQAYGEAIRRHA